MCNYEKLRKACTTDYKEKQAVQENRKKKRDCTLVFWQVMQVAMPRCSGLNRVKIVCCGWKRKTKSIEKIMLEE